MRAAQINSYGGKDVVNTNNNVDKPLVGEGQVLVTVHAAGVNPFDITVREGFAQQMAELKLPATLGADFAGIISEIGANVTGFELGDEVYGQAGALSGQGSFAEFTPVKAGSLSAKPKSIDFVTAAAVPLAAVSAYQAVVDTLNIQSGQKVLIHGGTGGVGSFAVQLAKNLGAHVATTVSTESVDFAKNLGADEIIDYKNQDFTTLLKDYDAVFDTVGGDTNLKSYQVLKSGGKIVSLSSQPNEELVKRYNVQYSYQFTQTTQERLAKVAGIVDSGALKVYVDKVFSLNDAADALEYLKSGHPRGKVVINVTD